MVAGFPQAGGGFAAGSHIGGYLLEEQIGVGGMAVVFRALDEKLGRRVALKILAPALAADPSFRQRFVRESRAAAAVDDPHIIPLYEAGEADGVLFIAMRYVHGGDVRTMLGRQGALDAGRVAAIVSPVASALDAAHAAGLVHRDVKPANMLLDVRPGRPDHVYLSDFGLSKEAAGSSGLTGTGLFLGTVDYAAPEQIDGRQVDGRTDQYSLACAAFEMLCGQPPFRRDQGLAVLHAHLSAPPPRLGAMRAGLPAAADAVFARALAKAPQDRYASCGDFSDALRGALGLAPYNAGQRSDEHPQTELAGLPGAGPAAGGGGAGLAAGGGGAGLAAGGGGAGPAAGGGGGATVGMDLTAQAAATAGTGGQGAVPGAPGWPAQPVQVPHPAWVSSGQGGRRPARWPLVVLAVAIAAAVAGGGVWLVLTARSGTGQAGSTGGGAPAAATSSAPAGSAPAGSASAGSVPASAASGTSPAPATTGTAPAGAGWTTYEDASGFSVQLPPGWAADSATRTGDYPSVDFTGPAPGFHLFIQWTTTKAGRTALPAWQRQAASFARNDPTYQLIQLQQVAYRSYNSAVWEFTNVHDGVLTHVIDLGIVVEPGIQGYAIELYGPQAEWQSVYGSMWNQVLASFEPAP